LTDIDIAASRPVPMGLARLATTAFRGGDLRPLAADLAAKLAGNHRDAAALYDLAIIFQLFGEREKGLAQLARALSLERVYHRPSPPAEAEPLSLLMFAVPGDFMANTPIEFILQDAPISLHIAYIGTDGSPPSPLPDHDVAFVGIGESTEAKPPLAGLASHLAQWPRPVLNAPLRIADLARERLFRVLADARGIAIPATVEVDRRTLSSMADGILTPHAALPDADSFPIIVRPVGSHAGHGLERLDGPEAIGRYLEGQPSQRFFLSRFIDYSSPVDGLFRKYRIAIIDGEPFLCHMAISRHWMVHYLNAGMTEDAAKRAEEAAVMSSFKTDFARRHATAFAALHERIGLDYFAVDCAESCDGRLLIFEADTAMIIHSMDPPEMFPYKAAQMSKAYAAFQAMLRRAAGREAKPGA